MLRKFEIVRYKKILIKSHFMRKVLNNANPKKIGKNHVLQNLSSIMRGLQERIIA
jgi:hypothetical protein